MTTKSKSQSFSPNSFLDHIDAIRVHAQASLEKNTQSEMGQFFTPLSISKMMAGMFSEIHSSINLLDPGAGVGSLSAAFVARAINSENRPNKITITAFELDPILAISLRKTLSACLQICKKNNIDFEFQIREEDFIASAVETISGKYSLFAIDQPNYNFAILNPPYKKINSNSKTRRSLNSIGLETTNLYTAFLWLTMKLIAPNGEMVAIVPRSFCNGVYFRPFRFDLLRSMRIKKIHIFDSRDKAFEEGDVLQENIIFHAVKTTDPQPTVQISSSQDPNDENIVVKDVTYDQLVHPGDPDLFIRIIPDQLGHEINDQMNNLTSSLKELGITVSTGRVVDFRAKEFLRLEPDKEVIPLIYPHNLQDGLIIWPRKNGKKNSFLSSSPGVDPIVIPSQHYVLVKRFSSKEERRRVYAAVYNPNLIHATRVGIENHINYFHRRYGGLTRDVARGLAAFLNSTLVDQYFRQFSGHTQVNATDLRNLKYPTEDQLISLGKRIGDRLPNQDEIDQLVSEEVTLQNSNNADADDPILAKRKIKEALKILQMLAVPRAQQNDRSALTLLALTNIKASSKWDEAEENLVGITEMMDFFRDKYGINYAPNTRETVRRQTIHQFIQLGLAIANPDDRSRPINSPKTRYIIEPRTLALIRSFGIPDWDGNLRVYLKNATSSLTRLQVRERAMPMIPVTLPDGEEILLSSGGHNTLIKSVIEEFCPRFTPGGKVIYIGDAGGKLSEKEIQYFEQLGVKVDRHGKMPDLVIELPEKKWLVLVEAVTSHGPIDLKRHNELKDLFSSGNYGLVFVTAFETRKAMHKYLVALAWETEVWVSEAPSHLIHFDGEKFLGPYTNQ